ncbi:hypothetical protein TBLA_0D01760 [Henningerozyma blattae CBS 6284]|uniref:IMP-specific 5'-nucleotidase 1 n=1 Tax=Henningerozyma blattae (strain ATCC 34711 / CBS 6284 / DSM 70876 / NBRC 10599 / NRRL Y-10934 / UCD 77-7) TaxID=1071380 RepID=I2H2T2_HENB6|nr:hypothetical protein TBLA_0D01760 [Tetrapisispora blattae CBS 6284]CCH60684.1 hypothetical protein TBLA_0D01760 [Tetrapisispora blattae CBS 6284]
MSSRYRVEYQLKQHKKDEFIEWIKALLATPFVLHAVSHIEEEATTQRVRTQYADIFQDIESLIQHKIEFDNKRGLLDEKGDSSQNQKYEFIGKSRLNRLVPSIGPFFTPLPLTRAFLWEDDKRAISERRMVSPSFNDVRHILNTAQIFHFISAKENHSAEQLKLVTFDGDVTLYEDGGSITDNNPVVPLIMKLLKNDIRVGIVTAAGYDEPAKYVERLNGLIKAMYNSTILTTRQKENLTVMGGESNYLFQYHEDESNRFGFQTIECGKWMLKDMQDWDPLSIEHTLDFAEKTLQTLRTRLRLPKETMIIRKARAVGLVPGEIQDPITSQKRRLLLSREQLEEVVLTLHQTLMSYPMARKIQFSCFDGGSDVWCDIGGKDLGVTILQKFYDPQNIIKPSETLHVGDQFSPMIQANDIKTRLAGTTLWIASPAETVDALSRLVEGLHGKD